MSQSRITEQQWGEMIAAYQAGKSVPDAASIYAVSRTHLTRKLKAEGVVIRTVGETRRLPLRGRTFGKLLAVEFVVRKGKNGAWRCQCDCGRESLVQAKHLAGGRTSSCGECERDDLKAASALKIAAREQAGVVVLWKAYRYRLKTTPRIEDALSQIAGCARYVYNRALSLNLERAAKGEGRFDRFALQREITKWRADPETPWLKEMPVVTQYSAVQNLESAYVNFIEGRAGAPKFKKKGKSLASFRFPVQEREKSPVDSARGRVRLPKVGWLSFFNSRPIEGEPKRITVSRRGSHWFVSIQTAREVLKPEHPHPESAVGIDRGIAHLASLSTGEQVPSLNAYRRIEPKLRRLKRRMDRKVTFSANWKKAKEKVARINMKAANCRRDHLHKLTTRLSKNHATIVIEALRVKNMSRSAKGTVESPGKNVKQKSGLNKAILDQGWGLMSRQLECKAAWNGGRVVKVNPAFSSQTCHRCGLRDAANRPSQSRFACLWCGLEMNADVNAARVILAVGQTVMACGGISTASQPSGCAAPKPDETGIAPRERG